MPERLAIMGGDAAGHERRERRPARDRDLDIVAFERGGLTSFSACGIPSTSPGWSTTPTTSSRARPTSTARSGIDVRIRHAVTAIDLDVAHPHRLRPQRPQRARRAASTSSSSPPARRPAAADPRASRRPRPPRTIDAGDAPARPGSLRGGADAVVSAAATSAWRWPRRSWQRNLRVTLIDQAAAADGDAGRRHGRPRAGRRRGPRHRRAPQRPSSRRSAGRDGAPARRAHLRGRHPRRPRRHRHRRQAGDRAGAARRASRSARPARSPSTTTSAPADGVYAAGDCVESHHRLLDRPVNVQLGTHANKQGRIAGVNLTGGDLAFPGVIGTADHDACATARWRAPG